MVVLFVGLYGCMVACSCVQMFLGAPVLRAGVYFAHTFRGVEGRASKEGWRTIDDPCALAFALALTRVLAPAHIALLCSLSPSSLSLLTSSHLVHPAPATDASYSCHRWKIDLQIVPLATALYLLSFLDRYVYVYAPV